MPRIGCFNPEDIVSRNKNDCWTIALMYALGKTYEDIRALFKPFMSKDGSLRGGFVTGILTENGYKFMEFEDILTVKEAIMILDSASNHLVIMTKGHTFYVSHKTIYDSMTLEQLAKKHVLTVFFKEKHK